MTQKPVLLMILDGWGWRRPKTPDNAIEVGHTPNWHRMYDENPHSLIETYGLAVGLPEGQMGNSEVGHTNIGAGRVVMQDLPKIDQAIKDGSMQKNPVLVNLIETLKKNGGAAHVMGLMSPGGVHSSQAHIVALCKILNQNNIKVWVHAFLDGRDTPPSSAVDFLAEFEKSISPPLKAVSMPWTVINAGIESNWLITIWLLPKVSVLRRQTKQLRLLMPTRLPMNLSFLV